VGYAENALLPLGPYSSFRGQAVDGTAVLIGYVRTGDANLDGAVDDDDVTIVGATYAPRMPQPHWALGDFEYNGFVDDDDVTLLGAFYQPVTAAAAPPTQVSGGEGLGVGIIETFGRFDVYSATANEQPRAWRVQISNEAQPKIDRRLVDLLAESAAAQMTIRETAGLGRPIMRTPHELYQFWQEF
jgi:hypothetical protein